MSATVKFPPPTHDSIKAKAARAAFPGYGYCGRCGMPWVFVDGHTTWYSEGLGCFPLCEGCWTLLGHPEARIEYYGAMLDAWERDGLLREDDRRVIGRAVAAGR